MAENIGHTRADRGNRLVFSISATGKYASFCYHPFGGFHFMSQMRFLAFPFVLLLMTFSPAQAAFDGAKVKALVAKLREFSAANCDKPKAAEVTQAIGLLEGSLTSIKDEKIRAAHTDQLRNATSDIREPLMQAILGSAFPGPPLSDCAKKVEAGIKKLNSLPITGTEVAGPATHGESSDAK